MSEKTLLIIAAAGIIFSLMPFMKKRPSKKYLLLGCTALGLCVLAASHNIIFKTSVTAGGSPTSVMFGTMAARRIVRRFPWQKTAQAVLLGGGLGLFVLNNGMVQRILYSIPMLFMRLFGIGA